MWFDFSWPFNFHISVVCNTCVAWSPGNFLFYTIGIITTDTEQVVNQKRLKRDQILDIVPQLEKYKGWLRSFRGKRVSASHCTGHNERTTLQRQDLGGQRTHDKSPSQTSSSRFLSKQCIRATRLEWLLVLILTWCVPGQSLFIELDHHLRCQDAISNHPQLPSWRVNSLR